jgi:hypothetical protein
MKAVCLGVLGVVLLYWVPATPAQTQGELPAAAQELLKQFEDEAADIEKKTEAELAKRREKMAVELKKVQDELCKEAKLDEAVAVRDLIRSLKAGTNVVLAPDLPAAAREVYKQYQEEVTDVEKKAEAEIKTRFEKIATELKKIQDLFCKEAKLDEAVAVRDLIRSMKEGGNALPDPGYVNNGANDIGKVFFYTVVGVTTGQSIYGSDVYTTGSHLGMAAVHCGLLKDGQTGVVKVTILPGQANYPATTRHGITSYAYGQWGVSFKVERGYRYVGRPMVNALPDPGTLTGHRAEVGKSFFFEVTGSDGGSIWGTDIYTDDSALASAAVHAGVLAVGQKGIVKVTILSGQDSYTSSTRNGLTSGSWGNWVGSYRVERAR